MATYSLSRTALADLDDIWDYIAQDSSLQADKMQDRIFAACQKVANNTELGRPRPELRSGLRSFPAKPYTLFYTIDSEEAITVRRIIHYSRDLDALF
jgi:toxin ParE1/3/4